MITLYYAPETRAARPRWILEELGVPHELRRLDVDRGENKSPEYLKLHPLGRIPALVDGEVQTFQRLRHRPGRHAQVRGPGERTE
jgi:glutathione S-transferase